MTSGVVPDVAAWVRRRRAAVVDDLCQLVALDTTTPNEETCFELLSEWFESVGMTSTRELIHPRLADDPDFTRNDHVSTLSSRANLRARAARVDDVPTTLFSAHADVVPAPPTFTQAFAPTVTEEEVVGRGAADTKNNIVMLLWALRAAREFALPLARNVACDVVVEEEIGGNGALSTILHGIDADEVVVLEPTGLVVHHGHRGYLTFEAELRGIAAHIGGDGGQSAIDLAFELIAELRDVARVLSAEADADPAFGDGDRVVRLNIGRIMGGEWHGSVPEHCLVGASVGFVAGRSPNDVRELLRSAAKTSPALAGTTFRFDGIHNDAYLGDVDAPVARRLRDACATAGVPVPPPSGWNVSCDARLYFHRAKLPTVVFGSGDLGQAHTGGERLRVDQLLDGIATIAAFLTDPRP